VRSARGNFVIQKTGKNGIAPAKREKMSKRKSVVVEKIPRDSRKKRSEDIRVPTVTSSKSGVGGVQRHRSNLYSEKKGKKKKSDNSEKNNAM